MPAAICEASADLQWERNVLFVYGYNMVMSVKNGRDIENRQI